MDIIQTYGGYVLGLAISLGAIFLSHAVNAYKYRDKE